MYPRPGEFDFCYARGDQLFSADEAGAIREWRMWVKSGKWSE